MRKLLLILFVFIGVGAIFVFLTYRTETKDADSPPSNTPSIEKEVKEVDFTAEFEIYTLGTKRTFSSKMYHNQSEDVYIQNPNPNVVHIKKDGITWADFFENLPFKLEKNCLLTGSGETFCNTESQKLHFTLNGTDTPNALDLEIMPGDMLLVEYY